MTREEVYKLIDGELEHRSKTQYEGPTNITIGNLLLTIKHELERAQHEYYARQTLHQFKALAHVRKAAAVAVRLLELHGAPEREVE